MPEWKIQYNREFVMSPMTPWVHRRMLTEEGAPAIYDPPRPQPLPGKGYPMFVITADRFPFTFASLHELDEAIKVLGEPVLQTVVSGPRKKQLPVQRKLDPHGASQKHWTARLPKAMEGWARRRKIVFELQQGRDAIKRELGPANVERSYGRFAPGA